MGLARALAARLGRAARREEGSTTVEFALVAIPFLSLVGAIFEASLLALAQTTLDNALDAGARQVFTGAFQAGANGTDPAARLRKAMCESGPAVYRCADLKVEVTKGATFSEQSPADPYDKDRQALRDGFGSRFECPGGNEVVTVRAASTAPRLFTFLDFGGRKLATGGQLIMSTVVFQAEPYANGRC